MTLDLRSDLFEFFLILTCSLDLDKTRINVELIYLKLSEIVLN
jgi:hypothetical protein